VRTSARRLLCIALACALFAPGESAEAQRHADVYDPGANGPVYAIAPQPDGKVVVGGAFTQLDNRSYPTRFYLGRFNYDGFLDLFGPVPNGQVHALALQPDGKILMGGTFNQINGAGGGALRQRLARLHPDGSTDATFNPGVNGTVRALERLADGRILVAGDFTTIGGGGSGNTTRRYIARLNSDGSLDTTFHVGANGPIRAIAVQPDGKILLGGQFTTLGGGYLGTTPRNYLGRVNADGTLDESFNPGATSWVHSIAVQADRMIVVAGTFTGLGGGNGSTPRGYIGRLHRDGSVDTSFNAFANAVVNVVTIQPDGKTAAPTVPSRRSSCSREVTSWSGVTSRCSADGRASEPGVALAVTRPTARSRPRSARPPAAW
jgi:uncharacterized delta-60 repeat protein